MTNIDVSVVENTIKVDVIAGTPITVPAGTGDMQKIVYDTNDNGIVDEAEAVAWSGVTGKPTTFPPSAHTHVISEVIGLQSALDGKQNTFEKGISNGYASLDGNAKVPDSQLNLGVANGIATLDGDARVPESQMPSSYAPLELLGNWDANTNTPTLVSGVGQKNGYYIVNVAGNTNLDGETDWDVGDFALFNGVSWIKIDNTGATDFVTLATNQTITGQKTFSAETIFTGGGGANDQVRIGSNGNGGYIQIGSDNTSRQWFINSKDDRLWFSTSLGSTPLFELDDQNNRFEFSVWDMIVEKNLTVTGGSGLTLASGETVNNIVNAIGLSGVDTSIPTEKAVRDAINARVYGTEYQKVEDLTISTTTSTTFQNKLTLTTPVIPAGEYSIVLTYGWNYNANNNDFESELVVDGGRIPGYQADFNSSGLGTLIHKQEPRDSAGNIGGTGSSQLMLAAQEFNLTLTNASHTFDFNYRTDTGGIESSVWGASLHIKRVA